MSSHKIWPCLLGIAVLSMQLTGCATSGSGTASPVSTPAPAVASSNLTGNYLLLGSMPSYFVSTLSNQTNLAVSFTLSGNTISGSANFQGVCGAGGGFSEGYVSALTGAVNADGSFTASYTSNGTNAQTFTIQGTVPKQAQGSWSGTFTYAAPGTVNSCASSYTGAFTAAPFPSATGMFSGSGALTSGTGSSGIAVSPGTMYTLATSLTQSGTGAYASVSGTLQVSGFPCFTHGTNSTVGTNSDSSAESNVLNLAYTMDDGASVQLASTVNNTAGTQLAIDAIYVRGDSCAGNYYFYAATSQNPSTLLLNR